MIDKVISLQRQYKSQGNEHPKKWVPWVLLRRLRKTG